MKTKGTATVHWGSGYKVTCKLEQVGTIEISEPKDKDGKVVFNVLLGYGFIDENGKRHFTPL